MAERDDTTGLVLKRADQSDARRWDDFVDAAPAATFFHRYAWREVIGRAFGHDTFYLIAERGDVIEGVLPLAHIRSALFGKSLISLPFCVYGGCVTLNAQAHDILTSGAQKLAAELAVDYLELRQREPANEQWLGKDLYVTFRKEIDPDPDVNLAAIPRKQRAMVRKGIKAGLTGEVNDEVDLMYDIYAESVRNLGTPVFGRRYFHVLKEVFGDACEILCIRHHGEIVSGVMSFYFRDEVLPYYGGGSAAARDTKANDFMYWELMKHACQKGVRLFDFGRSKKDTGSYRFKRHWGFEPVDLDYRYHLVQASEMPNVSPTNPKYRLFINAWKRLPLPVARTLGPMLARHLG